MVIWGQNADFCFFFFSFSSELNDRLFRFLLNDDPTHRPSSLISPSQQIALFRSNGFRAGYSPQQLISGSDLDFGFGTQSVKRKPPKN